MNDFELKSHVFLTVRSLKIQLFCKMKCLKGGSYKNAIKVSLVRPPYFANEV